MMYHGAYHLLLVFSKKSIFELIQQEDQLYFKQPQLHHSIFPAIAGFNIHHSLVFVKLLLQILHHRRIFQSFHITQLKFQCFGAELDFE